MRRLGLAALAVTLAGVVAAPRAQAQQPPRARFDTRVFALIPRPGFPAHAYAAPNGRIYEGTYENQSGDSSPSRVLEYASDGDLLRSFTVRGQQLDQPHGIQAATSDGAGRIVMLGTAPAQAIRLDPRDNTQVVYADFPAGAVPNHAAWGPDGSLYVTDYHQPILWRIPPGGGTPEPWLRDQRLNGLEFGTTGIALTADRRALLVGQQSSAGLGAGNPTTGRIYTVPIGADGRPGPPQQLWESRPLDAPDAFAVAQSGNIYVALLLANKIAVIGPDGVERTRFDAGASPVPFDNPSNARFTGGDRLVVANQSFLAGDASHQAILDVYVGEPGLPEYIPPDPATEARKAAAAAKAKVAKAKAAKAKRAKARRAARAKRTRARRARERAARLRRSRG